MDEKQRLTSEQVRQRLIEIGSRRKLAALDVIEKLHPFYEEMQKSGSIILRKKLDQHAELINKIFNDIIETGVAKQDEVIELRVCLKDLQSIYDDLRNYYGARAVIEKDAETTVERKKKKKRD